MPTDSTGGVERFDPQLAGATEEGFLPMDAMPEGEWVRFSDYEAVTQKLREEGRELEAEVVDYRDQRNEARAELTITESKLADLKEQLDEEVVNATGLRQKLAEVASG